MRRQRRSEPIHNIEIHAETNRSKLLHDTYDSLHPPLIRNTIEEHYGELILNNSISSNDFNNIVREMLLEKCSDIIEIFHNKDLVTEELDTFMTCASTFPGYVRYVIATAYVKKAYISLINQNHDPDDTRFKHMLTSMVTQDSHMIVYFTGKSNDGSIVYNAHSLVSEFIRKARTGTTLMPIMKPYLNYVPTKRAKDILARHILLLSQNE